MKKFNLRSGETIAIERETKTLKLIKIENTDYYKGKNHDEFLFRDSNDDYIYNASLNADMTEYDTKFATDLIADGEGKYCTISAYFVPTRDKTYFIYNPRLLDISED